MGLLLELLLEGLSMLVLELLSGVFWAFFSSIFPAPNDAHRGRSALAWAVASFAGCVGGLASSSFAPTHLARGPALVALTWIAFPLAGAFALQTMTRLQRPARRAPGIAFVAGLLFALVYLGVRAAVVR